VWQGGGADEPALLRAAYRHSFALAREHGVVSIAFPAISTGVYAYPKDAAAAIAVDEMRTQAGAFERIIVCCFSESDAEPYRRLLAP